MAFQPPPLNLSSQDSLGFNTGATDIKTGGTFNFSKPASATGIDLSFNAGWLLLAGIGVVVLFVLKRKTGA